MSREVGSVDSRGKARVQTEFHEPSLTIQSDSHLSDIREILRRFNATGVMEHLQDVDAQFMDVSEFTDYADMMNHVRTAEAEFLKLPAEVRKQFKNDVAVWLDAAHAPDRAAAAAEVVAELEEDAGVAPSDPPAERPPAVDA